MVKIDFKKWVNDVPDFPIPGVVFRDLSPLFLDPLAFGAALESMVADVDLSEVDSFVGVESRGFIFAGALAEKYKKGFIPLRKAGKLPPPVQALKYELEYGSATLEMRRGHGRVMVIDDVLATGGTLSAALRLAEASGFEVVDVGVMIDLRFLNEFRFRGRAVRSVIRY